jgi:hypothetical protein
MSLIGIRGRLSLLVSLLLVLTALMAVGVVCACSSDHSLQAIEKVVQSAAAAIPTVAVVWCVALALVAWCSVALLVVEPDGRGRASPRVLQRFLI